MKELINDFMSEGFTSKDVVKYLVLYPLFILLMFIIAGWLERFV